MLRFNIDTVSFQEFIEFGVNNGDNVVNGIPWSFKIHGYPVSHENNELYLITTPKEVLRFTPKHFLVFDLDKTPTSIDIRPMPELSESAMSRLKKAIWGM